MVYRTREEHANHHTINVGFLDNNKFFFFQNLPKGFVENSCTRCFFSFFLRLFLVEK